MIILPEFQKSYIIESATSPCVAKHFWAFSGTMLDYTLLPITFLEETTGAAVTLEINEFEFTLPYNWFIMVSDPDTLALDFMQLADCATVHSYALTMTPQDSKFRIADIKIKNVVEDVSLVHPMLQKNTALCHPIGEIQLDNGVLTTQCVVAGPYDLWKHLNGKLYGDLL